MALGETVVAVRLFGDFTLTCGNRQISERLSPAGNQSWQLLKYLLVNMDRPVTIAELARELAFSGRVEDIGNTIRVRLRRSRKLLDSIGLGAPKTGLLLYGGDQFWVNPDYMVETDQQQVDRLFMAASEEMETDAKLSLCIEGLGCFGGHYLENSKPSSWVSGMRSHYDMVYLSLLEQCIQLMEQCGNYAQAAAVWGSALRLVPGELPFHEALLRGLLKADHLAEAATYYSKLAVALANTELAVPEFGSLMQ